MNHLQVCSALSLVFLIACKVLTGQMLPSRRVMLVLLKRFTGIDKWRRCPVKKAAVTFIVGEFPFHAQFTPSPVSVEVPD